MKKLLMLSAVLCCFAAPSVAMASGRAKCPGATEWEGGGVGIIMTKSNDMSGTVTAKGATRCTIKFQDRHKTAPYCNVSGVVEYHISAKVLRTTASEVTFTFDPPLGSTGHGEFSYDCMFRD
jgi:hypothetical protein